MRIDCERSPRLRSVNVCVIVGLSDREERRGKEGQGKDRRRKALLTAQHHVSRKQGSCMEEMMRTHALRRIIFHDGYFVLRVPLSSLGSWG